MDLQGKRILVTGGSSGIGFAIAKALGAKGARIFITGRRQEALDAAVAKLKADGVTAGSIAADVGTEAGRAATLKAAVGAMGGLDGLINNAGAVRASPLEETSEAEIRTMIDVDLLAPILLTRAALPELRRSGDAIVVNISSSMGLVAMPFYTTYAAVKAGISHFGKSLRRELNGEGIRVMTVYPGATDTPMMQSSNAVAPKESPEAVADATVAGIEENALHIIRGGEERAKMIALNRDDPAALDANLLATKDAFRKAVEGHSAL